MLFGGATGGALELRRDGNGGVRLRGRFPYGEPAELSDGGANGRPLVEIIDPGAFSWRIGFPNAKNIHLLSGHDFAKPLASVENRTLVLRDTPTGVEIEATISPAIMQAQYARDAIAQVESGLSTGISPGFRLPPERVIPRAKAEVIEQGRTDPANGLHGAIIRRVKAALLYEFSVVTRPAYHGGQIQIEARNWQAAQLEAPDSGLKRTLQRWRL